MERREPDVRLTAEHRDAVVLGEHVDRGSGPLNDWRTNEDAGERPAGEAADVERGFERLPLPSVAVPPHGDVEHVQRLLVGTAVDDLMGTHDQPRAGRERGEAAAQGRGQRGAQLGAVEQLVDGGRLSPRQDDRADAREMLWSLDERDVSAEGAERLSVLVERALQGNYSDLHGLAASLSPASLGEFHVEVLDLLAAHRFTEAARHLGEN